MEYTPSLKDSKVRVHVIVRGVVQGVFYRASLSKVAKEHGIKGWVRNLPDGESVEAVLEGESSSVERVLCWMLRGPPAARVAEASIKFYRYMGEFDRFEIRL